MPRVYILSNVLMALPTSVPAKVLAVDMVSLMISRTGGKASANTDVPEEHTKFQGGALSAPISVQQQCYYTAIKVVSTV